MQQHSVNATNMKDSYQRCCCCCCCWAKAFGYKQFGETIVTKFLGMVSLLCKYVAHTQNMSQINHWVRVFLSLFYELLDVFVRAATTKRISVQETVALVEQTTFIELKRKKDMNLLLKKNKIVAFSRNTFVNLIQNLCVHWNQRWIVFLWFPFSDWWNETKVD